MPYSPEKTLLGNSKCMPREFRINVSCQGLLDCKVITMQVLRTYFVASKHTNVQNENYGDETFEIAQEAYEIGF